VDDLHNIKPAPAVVNKVCLNFKNSRAIGVAQ
jgi:hypothetical protein